MSPSPLSSITSCQIFYSTQSGRAKSCARRTARILREQTTVQLVDGIGSPFDETRIPFLELLTNSNSDSDSNSNNTTLFLMFVSTTGDGEQCDSIRNTWKMLLQKSLPKNLLIGKQFALFCLGDRAYGPQFCAGGRKLAVRLLQLGMTSSCEVGYGDDNTPNGGVFRDLDDWIDQKLLRIPGLDEMKMNLDNKSITGNSDTSTVTSCPFQVFVEETQSTNVNFSSIDQDEKKQEEEPKVEEEWQNDLFKDSYRAYFDQAGPVTAYFYNSLGERIITENNDDDDDDDGARSRNTKSTSLVGTITVNKRITASDWKQDTRHLEIQIVKSQQRINNDDNNNNVNDASEVNSVPSICELPYVAGDVASILPFNSRDDVDRFLEALPESLSSMADSPIQIDVDESLMDNRYTKWPRHCTLRGWLTYCADINSLTEREDLRTLSEYCSPIHQTGLVESEKLRSLSETSEAALYGDYILREKRSWVDVLYDFESLREPGTLLTMEALLMLLPPMRTRDFSIASAPSMNKLLRKLEINQTVRKDSFSIALCVAVVEGTTKRGRYYHGLCSKFLSQLDGDLHSIDNGLNSNQSKVQIWIRPGTFGKMPMHLTHPSSFQIPILCVCGGTGVAPMRSLLLERIAVRSLALEEKDDTKNDFKMEEETSQTTVSMDKNENILIFGCRKENADYYYQEEWETLCKENNIRMLTAFSQDQIQKIYVQKVLREADDGALIAEHMLERQGAVYIAGGPNMARCVKQELVEVLSDILGGEKQANKFLNKMQRIGRFNIEAWN